VTEAVSDDSGWQLSRLLLGVSPNCGEGRGCRWDTCVSFVVVLYVEILWGQLEVASLQLDR
jgi:hypothetical protein